jgi:hypothetical protein
VIGVLIYITFPLWFSFIFDWVERIYKKSRD